MPNKPISNTLPAPSPAAPKARTIHDVARALGVSKTTVSKAFTGNGRISPQTRDAVLQAARDMGFDLNPHAQRLSRGTSQGLVGLFCPDMPTGANGWKSRQIQRLLDAHGLEAPLYTSALAGGSHNQGQVEAVRRLRRLRPDAIVCLTLLLAPATLQELQAYQDEGGILVCYDNEVPLRSDQVIFDREHNTYEAARYLLSLGHRDIGLFLVGTPGVHAYATPRLAGFTRALQEQGLTVHTPWVWSEGDGCSEGAGAQLAERFLALAPPTRPTAMCIINESVANGFLNRVLRAGVRVPHEVSIVSRDNLPVAEYAMVPLSTMTHPVDEIAQKTADLLFSRLANPKQEPRRVVLRGTLIERESTAPPCKGQSQHGQPTLSNLSNFKGADF